MTQGQGERIIKIVYYQRQAHLECKCHAVSHNTTGCLAVFKNDLQAVISAKGVLLSADLVGYPNFCTGHN